MRLRGISVARRAVMLGERAAPPPPPPPPLASRAAAFENMRAAMASRFTSALSGDGGGGKGPSTGGTASHGDLGGRLPGLVIVKSKEKDNFSSQGPPSVGPTTLPSPSNLPGRPCVPTVEKPTVARLPVRSTSVWRPCLLLCKRLNVPVPEISKAVGWGRQGEEIPVTSTSSSAALTRDLLKEARRDERGPLAGGGGSVISKDKAAAVNSESDPSHPAKLMDSTMTADKSLVDVELANRPEIDLFKSIFEADSDVESNSSDSSTPEKGDDDEVRRVGNSSTLPFSSSSLAMLPQWSSAAAAHEPDLGVIASKLAAEMEKTEEDIINRKISNQTLERQKQLEVRLLKSERAEQEREKKKKRESEEGKNRKRSNLNENIEYTVLYRYRTQYDHFYTENRNCAGF